MYIIYRYIPRKPGHEMQYECNPMQVFCEELNDKHLFRHIGDKSGFDNPEKYRIRHTHVLTGYTKKKNRKKKSISALINDTLCIDDFFSDTEDAEQHAQLATVDDKKSNDKKDPDYTPTTALYESKICEKRKISTRNCKNKRNNKNIQKENLEESLIAKWEEIKFEQKVEDTLVMIYNDI